MKTLLYGFLFNVLFVCGVQAQRINFKDIGKALRDAGEVAKGIKGAANDVKGATNEIKGAGNDVRGAKRDVKETFQRENPPAKKRDSEKVATNGAGDGRESNVSVYDPGHETTIVSSTKGMELLRKAEDTQNVSQQVKLLNDAIKADPTLVAAYDMRGRALIGLRQYADAAKDFSSYIDYRPKDPDGYNNRGYAYLLSENYQDAISDFGMSLANNTRTPNYVYNNRGWAHAQSGEFQNAISDLDAAIKLDPNTENAMYRKGWTLLKAGNNQEALSVLEQVIARDPQNTEVWLSKGQANAALKQHKEAIVAYNKVLSIDKQNLVAFFGRSMSHYELGKIENAIEDCNAILKISPDDANSYNSRGFLYMHLVKPRYSDAISDFDHSLKLNNQQRHLAFTNRGEANLKLQKYKEARDDFQEAVLIAPTHQEALEGLAKANKILKIDLPGNGASGFVQSNFLKRKAIVIGNSTYRYSSPLSGNPLNDADDLSKLLRDIGFEVVTVKDADKKTMESAIDNFVQSAKNVDLITLFYAGHGMEDNGQNFLLPIDARIIEASHVQTEAISLEEVLSKLALARAKISLVFLDACRNYPFRTWKPVGRTSDPKTEARERAFVVPSNLSENVGVYYATKAKEVAGNGTGRNGNFTYGIKQNLRRGISLDDFWRSTLKSVKELSKGEQTPYVYGSIEDRLIF
ncbi:tetratricopeptide repeat protein [Dyadobacter diqingensis]|uniref:tetratricopeptide repeat protein n=1 Tax=Dyadobacter diqingensis TaxID=2938121 RepID=UPI0020C1B8DB|nr:tetratricopeptide repeat protein [Dyadobacter diqingensis]